MVPAPLGYVVAISRDSGLNFPAFPDIHETQEAAEHEAARLRRTVLDSRATIVVLELHEIANTGE